MKGMCEGCCRTVKSDEVLWHGKYVLCVACKARSVTTGWLPAMTTGQEQKAVQIRRYWVFEYDNRYPGGGMGDFTGAYDSLDDIPRGRHDFQEVLDTRTLTVRFDNGEWESIDGYPYGTD